MNKKDSLVILVDDDPIFSPLHECLLRTAGYAIQSFASALEFLHSPRPKVPACLVSDVRMPGLNGLDLQRELARAGWQIPIIFITGHGDVPTSVRAMKAGAVDFLSKPFREKDLLDAIEKALERDRDARDERARLAEVRRNYPIAHATRA